LPLTNKASARQRHGGNFIAGLLLLGALSARAADLPSQRKPRVFEPPPPEFNWTGLYLGIHAGGGVDHFAFPFGIFVPAPGGFFRGTSGITASGPLGASRPDLARPPSTEHSSGAAASATFGSKFEDFGTARLRLGYAWGRFLPYLTGGFTYGTIETFYSVATSGLFNDGSSTATRSGVFPHVGAVGLGAEYAIAQNFTVKVEYCTISSMPAQRCSMRYPDPRSRSACGRCIILPALV
jgi:outer membrane immunogenic protein